MDTVTIESILRDILFELRQLRKAVDAIERGQ